MTRTLWKIHSWSGLIGGIGLLLIGITGSLLVFRAEMTAIVQPDFYRVSAAGRTRLTFDALHTAIEQKLPNHKVAMWDLRVHPDRADLVYVLEQIPGAERKIITVDPYDGRVLCSPRFKDETTMGWIRSLHYTLLTGTIGILISGILALVLCILAVTGFYLYRHFWRAFFTLRWRKSARIFASDVHKMVGIPTCIFALILGGTGAYWNITHAVRDVAFYFSACEKNSTKTVQTPGTVLSIDAALAAAKKHRPDFTPNLLTMPKSEGAPLRLFGWIETANPLRDHFSSTLDLNPATMNLLNVKDIRDQSWGAQIESSLVPLHYGYFGGLVVKILYCISGLASGVLGVTGFIIWYKRRKQAA